MTATQVITTVGDFQEAVRKHVAGCGSLTAVGAARLRLELMGAAERMADELAAGGCSLGRGAVLGLLMEAADNCLQRAA